MASIHIVKRRKAFNQYGEQQGCDVFEVVFYCNCVDHYPSSSKDTIEVIGNSFEGTKQLETAWITSCCGVDCNTDFEEGDYAYLANKYWKIVGIRITDDCGCLYIKLTLERLEPREPDKALIECISCYTPEGSGN